MFESVIQLRNRQFAHAKAYLKVFAFLLLAVSIPSSAQTEAKMPSIVQQYTADRISLIQSYVVATSPVRFVRLEKFYGDEPDDVGWDEL